MLQPNKCTHCGGVNIEHIKPSQGTSQFITEIDTKQTPPNAIPTSGFIVNLFLCKSCGNVMSFLAQK